MARRVHEPRGMDAQDARSAPCAAVVVAAGEARRFGAQKLVMPFGGSTVIGSVVAALEAVAVTPIIVVVGGDAGVSTALRGSSALLVRNPDPTRGMLSSLQVGVARFLIALGDQPRLTAAGLAPLLRAHAARGKGIARPIYRGKRGHPVVFTGRYRQAILSLAETQTLRDVIHAHLEDCLEVECDSDAFVRDIDTQEEYRDELRRSQAES
jgi:molybdenum cofactor cytidylyltransferase